MRKLMLLLLLLTSLPARAESPALDVQHFQPHADQLGWFTTHSAATLDLWQPAFGVWFSYARDPLQFEYEDGSRETVVGNLATADVQAAIGFRYAELAVDMPVHLRVTGDGRTEWGGGFASTAAGDLRIVPKVRFLDANRAGVGLGLVLPLSFPSGNETAYTGRPTVAFSPMLAVAAPIGPVRLGGNLGYRLSGRTELGDLIAGNAFLYRVGVAVAPAEVAEFVAEVYGEVHSQDRNNPVEWLGGVVFRPMPTVGVHLAGGTSIGHGIGAPEGRVVVGIGWCARAPADSDGDGILDSRDICPDEPETKNGFQDDDGCPDEADRDGDGIVDDEDECPDDPEDRDNFEDDDGCPEIDNDGDGILDEDDRCRNDPEIVNGVDDDDGCPDEGLVQFDEEAKEIIIFEKVYFELARATILPQSHRVLDAVRDLLHSHPEILKVEVQGHTDKQGTADYNMKLSQQRADAVRDYMIDHGIEAERLTAVGYGESELLDDNDDDVAHARNRRVQFIVLQID